MQPRDPADGITAFAAAAATYETWFASPLGSWVDQQQGEALAGLLSEVPRGVVLDIGAGTGHSAAQLARWGHRVMAVEPSGAMRHVGQHHTTTLHVHWCAGRAETLPFRAGSCDGALLFTTLEFVQQPLLALHEARRVVRDGGWIVVGFLHACSPWTALYRHRAAHGARPWTAAHFFTRPELEELMGAPAKRSAAVVYLAPQALAPFAEAEAAGQRAGNAPALEILLWRTPV